MPGDHGGPSRLTGRSRARSAAGAPFVGDESRDQALQAIEVSGQVIAFGVLDQRREAGCQTVDRDRPASASTSAISIISPLSGVVAEALESSYGLACEDTPLAGSRLVIGHVPVLTFCPTCRAPRAVESIQEFCCAECRTPSAEVVQGRELQVALEIR